METKRQVELWINGERKRAKVDASSSLLDYLHSEAVGLMGTKRGCGQGGCGACTVIVSKKSDSNQIQHESINSCLKPLCSLDGAHITTVEGFGSVSEGISATQEAFGVYNASQCGYCTAGWVMSTHAAIASGAIQNDYDPKKIDGSTNDNCNSLSASCPAFSSSKSSNDPSINRIQDIEDMTDGNLCRCTGYRPILTAMKSFSSSFDDRQFNMKCDVPDRWKVTVKPDHGLPDIHNFSESQNQKCTHASQYLAEEQQNPAWITVTSFEQAVSAKKQYNNSKYCMGRTGVGIYPDKTTKTWIELSTIESMSKISFDSKDNLLVSFDNQIDDAPSHPNQNRPILRVGASVSYSSFIRHLKDFKAKINPQTTQFVKDKIEALIYMAKRTAGTQIRNLATIGGNIMLVAEHFNSEEPFPSDLFTVLSALKSTVSIFSADSEQLVELDIFKFVSNFNNKDILATINIPLLNGDQEYPSQHDPNASVPNTVKAEQISEPHYHFQVFKIAQRKQMAHCIVNCAISAKFTTHINQLTIDDLHLVVGGIKSTFELKNQFPKSLIGHKLDKKVLIETLNYLDVVSRDHASHAIPNPVFNGISLDYQVHLLQSLFFKFIVKIGKTIPNYFDESELSACEPPAWEAPGAVHRSSQRWEKSDSSTVAHHPMMKVDAFKHATGEIEYARDHAPPKRTIYGAYLLTDQIGKFRFKSPNSVSDTSWLLTKVSEHLQSTFSTEFIAFITDLDACKVNPKIMTERKFWEEQSKKEGNSEYIYAVEPVFVELSRPESELTRSPAAGLPIGIILAHSETAANEISTYIRNNMIDWKPWDIKADGPIALSLKESQVRMGFPEIVPPLTQYPPTNIPNPWSTNIRRPQNDEQLLETLKSHKTGDIISWPGGSQCVVLKESFTSHEQAHFYMETQNATAIPLNGKDGIKLILSSQSPTECQRHVSKFMDMPYNMIEVELLQLGGGFGGKTDRSTFLACAATLCSKITRRPVKIILDRDTDTQMIGKRHPFSVEVILAVNIGKSSSIDQALKTTDLNFQDDRLGKIEAQMMHIKSDAGYYYDCLPVVLNVAAEDSDSAYNVDQFHTMTEMYRTNKPANAAMRCFSHWAIMALENAIESASVQQSLLSKGITPAMIRYKSLYRPNDTTPYGSHLTDCVLPDLFERIYKDSQYASRSEAVKVYNQQNKYRKRGICIVPVKHKLGFEFAVLEQASALVNVYAEDGSVTIIHDGVEFGQGMNTKMIQIASDTLGLDVGHFQFSSTKSAVTPNSSGTGATSSSEIKGGAVRNACMALRSRLENFCKERHAAEMQDRAANPQPDSQYPLGPHHTYFDYWSYVDGWNHKVEYQQQLVPLWNVIVMRAYEWRIELGSKGFYKNSYGDDNPYKYPAIFGYVYAAAVTEVELDLLTGETTVLRADIHLDAAKSLNPAMDIGQIEGAFVQGLGSILTEEVIYQPENPNDPRTKPGANNSSNTWTYKPPFAKEIPLQFNVSIFPSQTCKPPLNPRLVLSSKSMGEPPYLLSTSIYVALQNALMAGKMDLGVGEAQWPTLDTPATPQRVSQAINIEIKNLVSKSQISD